MRDIEQIFRDGAKMSAEEKLNTIAKLSMLKATGNTADVMGVAISISPIGVDAHAILSGSLIERLGLEKEVEQFLEELTPIMEKYSKIVSERYRADFEKFVRGGAERESDRVRDAMLSILNDLKDKGIFK